MLPLSLSPPLLLSEAVLLNRVVPPISGVRGLKEDISSKIFFVEPPKVPDLPLDRVSILSVSLVVELRLFDRKESLFGFPFEEANRRAFCNGVVRSLGSCTVSGILVLDEANGLKVRFRIVSARLPLPLFWWTVPIRPSEEFEFLYISNVFVLRMGWNTVSSNVGLASCAAIRWPSLRLFRESKLIPRADLVGL